MSAPRGRAVTRLALGAGALLALGAACVPITGAPLSEAPKNDGCPTTRRCDAYVVTSATPLTCEKGRCEFGRPDYDFKVVVDVPTSSAYAPGQTFVLGSADVSGQPGVAPTSTSCVPPLCIQLPSLVDGEAKYLATKDSARAVGLPLPVDPTSLPVTVALLPLLEGTTEEAAAMGIPAGVRLTASRWVRKGISRPLEISYVDTVPVGRYRRVTYPEAPYDAYFPPAFTDLSVNERFDDFLLGDATTPLDDPTGDSRRALVSRAEGLEGWRVWLIESRTQRRISTLHTLSGKLASVTLHTTGWRQTTSAALKEDVEVIVAPPSSWLAVPRLQSRIINGQGLEQLVVPRLPPPATVRGLVASGEGAVLNGIPARLVFTSSRLRLPDGTLQPLLRYEAEVATDSRGTFRSVLPPGLYDVLVEPLEGTGFAAKRDTFDTSTALAKTFRPPPRTVVSGRVVLADGRPLSEADVVALPSPRALSASSVRPRPARTRTGPDGAFVFEADQGQYDFEIDPAAGTGFPRLVQPRSIGAGTADLGDLVVAPPARLAFKVVDPLIRSPIPRATVRVFAELPGRGPPAVEVGRAMSDDGGQVEILLAHRPN